MNAIRNFVAAVAVLFMTGCAGARQYVAMPDQSKTVEDSTKARIYVMRPATVGSGVSMAVTDGGKPIGSTGPHTFLCWERTPGQTILTSTTESENRLDLMLETNKVYYIFQHVRMGVWIARSELELISDPVEAEKTLKKCKPAKVELYGK
jgi:hypothetical protein